MSGQSCTGRTASGNPDAAIGRAVALHRAGQTVEAESAYHRILEDNPGHPGVLHNLALIAAARREHGAALELLDRALSADPAYATAHFNRGGVLQEMGRTDDALAAYARAAELDPANAEIGCRRGDILMARGDAAVAAAAYRDALAVNSGHYGARRGLGLAMTALGRIDDAMAEFRWTGAWRRDAAGRDAPLRVSRRRLRHDADQMGHLATAGTGPADAEALALAYERAAASLDGEEAVLDEARYPDVARTYRRPPHVAAPPYPPEGVLNPDLDIAAVADRYAACNPGIAWFDGLLTDTALAELRRFLLDSTIWHDHAHIDGYVAAYLEDGLACPLLLGLAQELRRALPAILGPHPLHQAWAFKCLAGDKGIAPHFDSAAVSLNFWITPEAANRVPGEGGLTLCRDLPPAGWRSTDYDTDRAEIASFMASRRDRCMEIAYRANRAVLFDSALFHGSGPVSFRPGYANHRINLTLLFGAPRL